VKIILNWVPPGVEAVKGWPLKKAAWISLGAMGAAAMALLPAKSTLTRAVVGARMNTSKHDL
jgi:hypothetical protein